MRNLIVIKDDLFFSGKSNLNGHTISDAKRD